MPFNPFSLENKTILVTGATSGIGKSVAINISRAGASVIVTGRDAGRLEEVMSQLSEGNHKAVLADLSNETERMQLISDLPQLDGVVHSAGIIKRVPLKLISEKNLNELMQINFIAPALLTRALYKQKLLKDEASIVFMSSVASSFASLGNIMYMASKGAINSFMKGIAFELASSGIRANAIQPGMIKTNLTTAIPDEEIQKDIHRYPLGRYGQPEEVAYAAIYLLSDATKWMTGSILTIDGGLTLR
jgi:NAD(P)-dependent dehydrogenase (short-subunit alcohol dehydrogenase family)